MVRTMRAGDRDVLLDLESASPERGTFTVRLDLRVPHGALAARYAGSEGYVAECPTAEQAGGTAEAAVAGMLFCSVAPTQWRGAVVQGAYLFGLRVHPAWRRRGVAVSLVEHAWCRARELGAALAWALVVAGNVPALRTFARAGFQRERDARLRIVLPRPDRPAWPVAAVLRREAEHAVGGPWRIRPAEPTDLPGVVARLNDVHAGHDLWRPCTPDGLAAQLSVPGHGVSDLLLATERRDMVGAAGAVLHLQRIARLRPQVPDDLPRPIARLVEPLLSRLPVQPRVLRYRLLSPGPPGGAGVLLGHLASGGWRSPLVIPMDPLDPAWSVVERVRGRTVPLHVVIRRASALKGASRERPMYLG